MRLSTRFAACLATLVPLLVLLGGLLVLNLVSRDLRAERDEQMATRAHALAPLATSYSWRVRMTPRLPPDLIAQRLAGAAAMGAGSPGGIRVEIPGSTSFDMGEVPATTPAVAGEGPATFGEGAREWRFVVSDLGPRGGAGRLWVFESEEHLDRRLGVLRSRLALVTLISAGVGVVAGLALGRFAVRPLAVLRGQARGIGASPVGETRLETASGVTEIDELAGVLNDLLDRRDAAVTRTGEALETARAFAATVAHELRTPLTSMGTNLELLGHPGLDPVERAEIVADLSAEHGRTQRLITMLRRLARGELVEPAAFAETDLAEITAVAVEEARRRHPRAAIAFSPTADLPVRGWAEGLRMIVDNLLDNAAIHGTDAPDHPGGKDRVVRPDGADSADAVSGLDRANNTDSTDHTDSGMGSTSARDGTDRTDSGMGGTSARDGTEDTEDTERATITVTLSADGTVAVLAVQDAGPGIPLAERDSVFTRFHRRPGSPGSGLGLTLIRQQVALHGGTVTVTDPEQGRGTRVEVRLPASSPLSPRSPTRPDERPPEVGSWLTEPRRSPP
ncbi:sensor histidine kinase [Streptosporangium sp. NPDC000095]|uniref:sensor histidine kinase n=1 Tax=Streptosporangium sp. NPDC000095 TaxID=3366184 RepID=UPI003681546D